MSKKSVYVLSTKVLRGEDEAKDYTMITTPAIVSTDFTVLVDELEFMFDGFGSVEHEDDMETTGTDSTGSTSIFVNVIDQQYYAPNLSMGPMICQSLRDHGIAAPIDVHLLSVSNPEEQEDSIAAYVEAGATYITLPCANLDPIRHGICWREYFEGYKCLF